MSKIPNEKKQLIDDKPDMDTCILNSESRKQFVKFIRQLDSKLTHLPFFYALVTSLTNHFSSKTSINAEEKQEIRKILEASHKVFEEKKLASSLSDKVRDKMTDTLKKLVYNEAVFRAVKAEVKQILETYYKSFLSSDLYKPENSTLKVIKPYERTPSFCHTRSASEKTSNNITKSTLKRTSLNQLQNQPIATHNPSCVRNLNGSRLSLRVPKTSSSSSTYYNNNIWQQNAPLNPYHAPSYPVQKSRQNSDVQSVVSIAYSEASVAKQIDEMQQRKKLIKMHQQLSDSRIINHKEVDIDIQNLQQQQQQQQSHESIHKLGLDVGISTKSVDSFQQVKDWIGNTKLDEQNTMSEKTSSKTMSVDKIPVVYHFPGEEQPFMSYFSGKTMTLGQFRDLINKKGAYKFFFKNICDLDGEKMVVFEEIIDEKQNVPFYEGKVFAKIQPID